MHLVMHGIDNRPLQQWVGGLLKRWCFIRRSLARPRLHGIPALQTKQLPVHGQQFSLACGTFHGFSFWSVTTHILA
jgi:hypothetical protein